MSKARDDNPITYVFNYPNINIDVAEENPSSDDVMMAIRRFVMRVCGDEKATPAELEAMTGVADLALRYA